MVKSDFRDFLDIFWKKLFEPQFFMEISAPDSLGLRMVPEVPWIDFFFVEKQKSIYSITVRYTVSVSLYSTIWVMNWTMGPI